MFSAMFADIWDAFIWGYAASNNAITRSRMDADATGGDNTNVAANKKKRRRGLEIKISWSPSNFFMGREGETAPSVRFINLRNVDYRPD